MGNLLIYAFVFMTALSNFSFGFCFSGANKVFSGLYKSVIQNGVFTASASGDWDKPYFDRTLTEQIIREYFADNLTRYVSQYNLKVSFYVKSNGYSLSSRPDEVDVYLSFKVALLGEYQRSASYFIKEAVDAA